MSAPHPQCRDQDSLRLLLPDRPSTPTLTHCPLADAPLQALRPVVLSPEEAARLLQAAPGPKYKAALSPAYGAGLRLSGAVALKVADVASTRILLRIEQGKGRRDHRHAMLSPQLLEL